MKQYPDERLRLTFIDKTSGMVVDVVDAYPASFYSWLPAWIEQYTHCAIYARIAK